MHLVILDQQSLDHGDLDLRALHHLGTPCESHPQTSPQQLADRIQNAEVVVTNKVVLDANALNNAQCLRLICVAATGVNNIDLASTKRNNITVCNVRGYATASVVQHVFAGLLELITRQSRYVARVQRGAWSCAPIFSLFDEPIDELHQKTLGIIGYGELGRAVARVAEAFGMSVVIAAKRGEPPTAGRLALDQVLGLADVLSLHCPLTEHTRGLIGARELAAMKPGAILINVARGGVVDEVALANALRTGHLGGAMVDVLTQEPPPPDHPLLARDIPNLLLTPHNAWASRAARQRVIDQIVCNIEAFQAGAPRNVVE